MPTTPDAAAPLQFAVPARPELVERVADLSGRSAVADLARERAEAARITDAYLDTVLDGLVRVFLRHEAGVGHGTLSLLNGLTGVISGAARSVLDRGLANASAGELLELRAFACARVRPTPEGPWPGLLVFPLGEGVRPQVDRVAQGLLAERMRDERRALSDAMTAVIDGAIRHHFEEPVALLHPGFLLRQGLAVAVAAIRSGAHAVLRRAIQHEGEPQLRALAKFLVDGTMTSTPPR